MKEPRSLLNEKGESLTCPMLPPIVLPSKFQTMINVTRHNCLETCAMLEILSDDSVILFCCNRHIYNVKFSSPAVSN